MKVTVHPVLHIVTMDRSECEVRPGMMCTARAPGGNNEMLRVHVCVEHTCLPFERRVTMGTAADDMFVAGALVLRKWLVAPELRMAHRLMVDGLFFWTLLPTYGKSDFLNEKKLLGTLPR